MNKENNQNSYFAVKKSKKGIICSSKKDEKVFLQRMFKNVSNELRKRIMTSRKVHTIYITNKLQSVCLNFLFEMFKDVNATRT